MQPRNFFRARIHRVDGSLEATGHHRIQNPTADARPISRCAYDGDGAGRQERSERSGGRQAVAFVFRRRAAWGERQLDVDCSPVRPGANFEPRVAKHLEHLRIVGHRGGPEDPDSARRSGSRQALEQRRPESFPLKIVVNREGHFRSVLV